jgi:LPS sulfotransferase NodH
MTKNCYIVAGPGRTGSRLICSLLEQATGSPVVTHYTHNKINNLKEWIYHTHNPKLQLDPSIKVICSTRKNIFDTVS